MTSQKELFRKIWREREPECSVCEEPLYDPPKSYYFSHVLPKGTYPEFKLFPENIILLCLDCHQKLDHNTHLAKQDRAFDWVFALKEELKVTLLRQI
jgi:5-methylcytosine-specific restriction endonuclease McrA